MPTLKQRAQVTITDDVRHALDLGARLWPEHAGSPAVLLSRISSDWARRVGNGDAASSSVSRGPVVFSNGGHPLSLADIEEALANDY
ncbi:MAG: hypothetical protein FWF43_05275 [Propionibacteriaceae bacterium]|nr:hypothetical protein [Propionibacteriaceae bacterium]